MGRADAGLVVDVAGITGRERESRDEVALDHEVAVVTPLTVVRVPVPIGVVPLKNVTVPVGFPAPGATTETVAVSVVVSTSAT